MKPSRSLGPATALLLPWLAHAHDGHGQIGPHWHNSDAWAYLLVAAAVALTVWLVRRK